MGMTRQLFVQTFLEKEILEKTLWGLKLQTNKRARHVLRKPPRVASNPTVCLCKVLDVSKKKRENWQNPSVDAAGSSLNKNTQVGSTRPAALYARKHYTILLSANVHNARKVLRTNDS